VPNAITLVRLVCIPVFLWLLAEDEPLAAAALLAVLGASDWVDGWWPAASTRAPTWARSSIRSPTVSCCSPRRSP